MHESNVSIALSDDSDNDHAGKSRSRFRRKRRKFGPRGKSDRNAQFIRRILKWWPLLILVFAATLLLYEAFSIGRKTSRNSELVTGKKKIPDSVRKIPVNLNRLDPVTRVIGGVRTPCLKLLSPEELEHLDFPIKKESTKPLKKLVYIHEDKIYNVEVNSTLSQQLLETTRFNLFTGYQTLAQRNQSFEIHDEAALIHCGFYSDKGGFRISEEDKAFMQSCKAVVSTCAFGGGDDLYQPIGMSELSLKKVCYVAFWDEITLAAQESEGHTFGANHSIGNWRIILVKDLPFRDQRLNGKIPKMLGHRLFPNSRYSIWVDSKSQFRRDPLGVLEALLWRTDSTLAISEHGARSSVYDEANAVVKKNKATPEEVEVQLAQYRKDGLPESNRFNGKKALAEASIIVREHTPVTNAFMCLWFNEVVRFTSRDQLSFPYVLWRFKAMKEEINMFPVCTRKDLVNSIGHIRKAKPLIK